MTISLIVTCYTSIYLLLLNLPLEIFLVFRWMHVTNEVKKLVTINIWKQEQKMTSNETLLQINCCSSAQQTYYMHMNPVITSTIGVISAPHLSPVYRPFQKPHFLKEFPQLWLSLSLSVSISLSLSSSSSSASSSLSLSLLRSTGPFLEQGLVIIVSRPLQQQTETNILKSVLPTHFKSVIINAPFVKTP